MPKKVGVNIKAEEAKAKKEEAKKGKAAAEQKQKEDQEWKDAGDGAKTKAQAKKDEQEKKRQEAAAKKAEAKKLAEEEAEELAKSTRKTPSKSAGTKVTSHQLRTQKEVEKQAAAEAAKKREAEAKRMVTEDDYEKVVAVENPNREDDTVEARSVEAALSALAVGEATPEDRHPERRARAAFAAYSERMIAELKEEKPGLKQSQYKDLVWKLWQKAPENPLLRPPTT